MGAFIADMERELAALATADAAVDATRKAVLEAVGCMKSSTQSLLKALSMRPDAGMAVSVPYLRLCGYVIGGWLLAKSAAVAAAKPPGSDREFYAAKVRTAAFYATHVIPVALGLARVIEGGAASVVETDAALI
jgi:hypothetical protein